MVRGKVIVEPSTVRFTCLYCGGEHQRFVCPLTMRGRENAINVIFNGSYRTLDAYDLTDEEFDGLVASRRVLQWLDEDVENIRAVVREYAACREAGELISWAEAFNTVMLRALEAEEAQPPLVTFLPAAPDLPS